MLGLFVGRLISQREKWSHMPPHRYRTLERKKRPDPWIPLALLSSDQIGVLPFQVNSTEPSGHNKAGGGRKESIEYSLAGDPNSSSRSPLGKLPHPISFANDFEGSPPLCSWIGSTSALQMSAGSLSFPHPTFLTGRPGELHPGAYRKTFSPPRPVTLTPRAIPAPDPLSK